jgi:signal transduction histidine kinase
VIAALGLAGWGVAAVLVAAVLNLTQRLELVARAEHEVRGPATVLSLAVERLRRDPAARRHVQPLDVELERLAAALDDLRAARRGGRAAPPPVSIDLEGMAHAAVESWRPALEAKGRRAAVDWRAAGARVAAAPGRVAQALGNLMANAVEHGEGPVELRGRRTARGVRVEVINGEERGRGLAVASAAAEDAGGRLAFESRGGKAAAAVELPASDEDPAAA